MGRILASASASLIVCLASAACGQEFEVASVRRNVSGTRGGSMEFPRGGERFTATNMPLGAFVLVAYNLTVRQLSGPGEFLSEPYDIAAKTAHPASPDEMLRMLRALLVDRFKLVVREEIKEVPVYALTVQKGGSRLHESHPPEGERPTPRTPASAGGTEPASGHLIFKNESMPDFAWALSRMAGIGDRVVVDNTGLAGTYDFELKFGRDASGDDPPLFSALSEQLGLKLESRKAPVRFLTIDHVERPSQN